MSQASLNTADQPRGIVADDRESALGETRAHLGLPRVAVGLGRSQFHLHVVTTNEEQIR